MVDLDSLGWSPAWQFKLDELGDPTLVPARVAATERTGLLLWTKDGERFTPLSGKHLTDTDRPTVGDWVALTPEPAVRVVDRLPRNRSSSDARRARRPRRRRWRRTCRPRSS